MHKSRNCTFFAHFAQNAPPNNFTFASTSSPTISLAKLGNDHELANYIEGKIADDGYSPETALHKIKEDGLTFSVTLSKWTVYKSTGYFCE